MIASVAKRLAGELVKADIFTDAKAGPHHARGQARTHGPSALIGHWREREGRPPRWASIVCEDVARNVLDAGGWTLEAIRSCPHAKYQSAEADSFISIGSKRRKVVTVTTIATPEEEARVTRTKLAPKPPAPPKQKAQPVAAAPKKTAAAVKPAAPSVTYTTREGAKVKHVRVDATICSERGCKEHTVRRGLCRQHYRAWLQTDRELVA